MDDESILLEEQLLHECLVIGDLHRGKRVERRLRGGKGKPGNLFAAPLQIARALFQLARSLRDVTLGTLERWLHGELHGIVRAEPRPGELADRVVLRRRYRAAQDEPSDAPSGREVVLREPAEARDGHVLRE